MRNSPTPGGVVTARPGKVEGKGVRPAPARRPPLPPKPPIKTAIAMADEPDEYLTAKELAAKMKLTERQIHRMDAEGRLPPCHYFEGRVKRWLWSEVKAFGAKHTKHGRRF